MKVLFTIWLCLLYCGISAQDMGNDFLEAIRVEEYNKAAKLLKDGANINSLDNKNRGALEITLSRPASDKRDKFARLLLKKKINVNPPTNGALYQCILNGKKKILATLLKRGAKPDLHRTWDPIRKNYRNETPLLYEAIKHNRPDMVELMLNYGADPNFTTKGYMLPITQAISNGDIDITQILIEEGAILTKVDSLTKLSAYGHVVASDNLEVFELLKNNYQKHPFDANTLDQKGNNGLQIMAATPNEGFFDTEIAEGLIEAGVDINYQRANGNTPLHDAIKNKKFKITQVLIDHGADTTIINNEGANITKLAMGTNDARFLNLFKIPEDNIHWKNAELYWAIVYKDDMLIEKLIADGAKVSGKMLALTIIENEPEILTLLLSTGVSPNTIDQHKYKFSSSKSIMEYAFKNRLVEVITILLANGYDIQKILPLEHRYALKVSDDFQKSREQENEIRIKELEGLTPEEIQLYNNVYCDVNPDKFRCQVEIRFDCENFSCTDKLFNHTNFELIDTTGKTIYKYKLNKKDIFYENKHAVYRFEISYFSEIPQLKDRGIHLIEYRLSADFNEKGVKYDIDKLHTGSFYVFNLMMIDQKFEVSEINTVEKNNYLDISFDAYYKFYENEIQSPDYYYEVKLKTKNGGEIFDGEKQKIKLDRKYSWTNARVPPENLQLNFEIPYGANYLSLGETETEIEINFFARSWGLVKEYNLLDSYLFPLVINQNQKDDDDKVKFKKDNISFDIFSFDIKEVNEYREYGRKGLLLNVEYVLRSEEGVSVPKIEFYPIIKDETQKVVYIPTFINEKNAGVEIYETVVTDKINFAPNRLNILEIFIPLHKINLQSGKNELEVLLQADIVNKLITYEDIYSSKYNIDIPQRFIYSVSVDSLSLKRSVMSDGNRSSTHKLPDPYWALFADKQIIKRVNKQQDAFYTQTAKTNFLGLDNTELSLIIYDEDLFWSDVLGEAKLYNQSGVFQLDTSLHEIDNVEQLNYRVTKNLTPEYSFRVVPNQKENGVTGIKIYTAYKYNKEFFPIEIHPMFSGINNSYSLGFITEEKVGSNNRFYSYAYIGDTTYVGFYLKLPNHSDYFDKTDKQKIISPLNIEDVSYELDKSSPSQFGDVYGIYINLSYSMSEYYLDSRYDIKHVHRLTTKDGTVLHEDVDKVNKSDGKTRLFIPYYKLKTLEQGLRNLKFKTTTVTSKNVTIGQFEQLMEIEVPELDSLTFFINTIKLKKKDEKYLKQSYSWNIFLNNDLVFTSKLVNADEKNQLHWPDDLKQLQVHQNDVLTIRLDYKSWDNTYPVTYWQIPIKKLKKRRGWYKLPRSKFTKKSYIKFR